MRLYIALVHYPVYNKHYKTIASAITTVDLHDLARLSRTYGVKAFFVITPLEDQQSLAKQVLRHWTQGYGARYNRHRSEAIALVAISPSLEQAIAAITEKEAAAPILIATAAARQGQRTISCQGARDIICSEQVVVLLFGTAWGLHKTVMDLADYALDPIAGRTGYNHLSVRTAAAIVLDRLAGAD